MQRDMDFKDRRFRDGTYEGTLIWKMGGERGIAVDITFADGKVTGTGECEPFIGKFEIAGTYSDKAPFDCDWKATPVAEGIGAVTFTGARGENGGLQGRWKQNADNSGLYELSFVEVDLGTAEPEKLIQILVGMGMDADASATAVNTHGMGVEEAVEWIANGCPPPAAEGAPVTPSSEGIASIMEMGFDEEVAKRALVQTNNDVERALNMLLS